MEEGGWGVGGLVPMDYYFSGAAGAAACAAAGAAAAAAAGCAGASAASLLAHATKAVLKTDADRTAIIRLNPIT